jgi:hypothetical protein
MFIAFVLDKSYWLGDYKQTEALTNKATKIHKLFVMLII